MMVMHPGLSTQDSALPLPPPPACELCGSWCAGMIEIVPGVLRCDACAAAQNSVARHPSPVAAVRGPSPVARRPSPTERLAAFLRERQLAAFGGQRDLARLLSLSLTAVNRWLNARGRAPTRAQWVRLQARLGASAELLAIRAAFEERSARRPRPRVYTLAQAASGVRSPKSGVRSPKSGVRSPASEVRRPKSGVRRPKRLQTPDPQIPGAQRPTRQRVARPKIILKLLKMPPVEV